MALRVGLYVLLVVGISLFSGVIRSSSPARIGFEGVLFEEATALAGYGFKDSLGTIGIATGVGATLGLSTLPFYDYPEDHLRNVLIGAGAGLIVGLGVAVYLMAKSPSEDEIAPEELLVVPKKKLEKLPEKKEGSEKSGSKDSEKSGARQNVFPAGRIAGRSRFSSEYSISAASSVPTGARMAALEPNQWVIAMPVLKLRF